MPTFTLVHVVISVIGLVSGFVVVYGFLTGRRLDSWTGVFLATTIATSVTGFGFSVDRLLPSHVVGLISLVVLAVASYARYSRRLEGIWRRAFVITAVVALYLNVFVLIVQSFLRVPALTAMAPTQSEPPFVIAQVAALLVFLVLGWLSDLRFRLLIS